MGAVIPASPRGASGTILSCSILCPSLSSGEGQCPRWRSGSDCLRRLKCVQQWLACRPEIPGCCRQALRYLDLRIVEVRNIPGEERGLQHAPAAALAARAAVQQVRVEQQHRAGLAEDQLLLGMTAFWLLHRFRQRVGHLVAAGNHAGRAVGGCEIVEEPQRCHHLERVGPGARPISVQRLLAVPRRRVAADHSGEAEGPAQDVMHCRQDLRLHDHPVEGRRQPIEDQVLAVTLANTESCVERRMQLNKPGVIDDAGEEEVALAIQRILFARRQRLVRDAAIAKSFFDSVGSGCGGHCFSSRRESRQEIGSRRSRTEAASAPTSDF